jgi:hypothetical protein
MQSRCARTRETNAIARRHSCCGLRGYCAVTFSTVAHLTNVGSKLGSGERNRSLVQLGCGPYNSNLDDIKGVNGESTYKSVS